MGGVASADVEVRCPSAWHPVSAYGEIPMSVVTPVLSYGSLVVPYTRPETRSAVIGSASGLYDSMAARG